MEIDAYLPLKPDVFLILAILRREPAHGYGLIQEAEESTDGRLRLQAGALYRRLRWMLDEGLIAEVEGGDERRRTYRITDLGEAVVRAEARRMAELMDVAGLGEVLDLREEAP